MSTVKTVNIQHPNSSNINMVLASDGSVSGGFPAGGRNKIINGGFDVWQRGTSFSVNGSYTADRWAMVCASGQTVAASQQLFTAGNPITGYEPTAYLRISWSGTPSGTFWFTQRIEDVRTFAGQTVTLSFWAKASSATSVFAPMLEQNFGSGGSGVASVNGNAISLTTSWQRFSQTFNVPSISGKTIGTNSYLDVRPLFGGSSVNGINVDIWGVQLESGSIATPFEVKPYAQELRDCLRYYERILPGNTGVPKQTMIQTDVANRPETVILYERKRTAPTISVPVGTNFYFFFVNGSGLIQASSYGGTYVGTDVDNANLFFNTASGVAQYAFCVMYMNASAYIEVSAEL